MPLAPGARLGPYEILSAIGAGGMGEVYRARDSRLQRDVAIKILPELFAADPDRVARFAREAQVLASLNHPHIAQIYGLEEAGDARALVLELVEGPTLADRIAQGPIPLDEALPIAKQIAEALEAAHEQGIIHRDLKPANIKLTKDGTVKVLDFGLAKLTQASDSGLPASDLANSPTITSPALATHAGIILGTAAYMSPEQAKGKPADKRSDVWAFGCVLFEMLTRKRAFEGDDVSDTMAAILRGDPDWRAVPPNTPPHVQHLLRRCLEKNSRDRLRDIGEARVELQRPLDSPRAEAVQASTTTVPRARNLLWISSWAFAATIGFAAGAAVWRSTPPSRQVTTFVLSASPSPPVSTNGTGQDLAISPDGRRVVYATGSPAQLYVRSIDRLEGTVLRDTVNATSPFFSPDGSWIAYLSDGLLKKVSLAGGPAVVLCPAGGFRGASWAQDDTIVFATIGGGLLRVSAAGGEPTPVLPSNTDVALGVRIWPEVLPGGRGILFMSGAPPDAIAISLLNLATNEVRRLIPGASNPRYSPTGHILYAVGATLQAVPFDLERMELAGDPVPVVEGVLTKTTGAANFSIASDGSLVYVDGGGSGERRVVAWVDRKGQETLLPGLPPDAYRDVRVSPDGSRLAVATHNDIWIYDVKRASFSRLTTNPAFDRSPLWTPDGTRVVFTSVRGKSPELFRMSADGSGGDERLLTRPDATVDLRANAWSQDGSHLLFSEVPPQIHCAISHTSLDSGATPKVLVQNTFCNDYAAVSPDGRWVAYDSTLSGRAEVYVERYPQLGGRQQISLDGGRLPLWAPDGRELFFSGPDSRHMLRVAVRSGESLSADRPSVFFKGAFLPITTGFRPYDIAPDGRFAVIRPAAEVDTSPGPKVVFVQNWAEELKRLVPVKK